MAGFAYSDFYCNGRELRLFTLSRAPGATPICEGLQIVATWKNTVDIIVKYTSSCFSLENITLRVKVRPSLLSNSVTLFSTKRLHSEWRPTYSSHLDGSILQMFISYLWTSLSSRNWAPCFRFPFWWSEKNLFLLNSRFKYARDMFTPLKLTPH